jgi:hypothetical protein
VIAPDRATLGAVIGAAVAVTVALAFVPLRDEIGNANVALALAVVVVAAGAVGRRPGGTVTAAVAATSFDFFHTRPFGALRVSALRDVATIALLFALGAIAGDLSTRLARARGHRPDLGQLRRLHRVASRAALGDTTEDLTLQVCAEMIDLLHLRDCWFEPAPFLADLPQLAFDGTLDPPVYRWVGDDFGLPPHAASIVLDVRGQVVGRFVLATEPDAAVPVERHLVAVALADQVRVALAASAH